MTITTMIAIEHEAKRELTRQQRATFIAAWSCTAIKEAEDKFMQFQKGNAGCNNLMKQTTKRSKLDEQGLVFNELGQNNR